MTATFSVMANTSILFSSNMTDPRGGRKKKQQTFWRIKTQICLYLSSAKISPGMPLLAPNFWKM